MEQYISKSALVAELKKRFDYRANGLKAIDNGTFWNEDQSEDEFNATLTRCAYNAVKNEVFELMCFLDTLEVKEVDLESEIKKIQKEYKTIDEYDGYPATIYASSIERIAKHFFELGFKAQKGEKV